MEESEPALHWSQHKENASGYLQFKLLIFFFKYFPLVILRALAFPVGFFYFLFSKRGRAESYRFLRKIAPYIEDPVLKKKCLSRFAPLRHIISFSLSLVERIQSWGGKFSVNDVFFQDDDMQEFNRNFQEGKGAFLLFSHMGNSMILLGILSQGWIKTSRKIQVTTILDMKISSNFSRMLKELDPQSNLEIINSDEVGSHTAVLLEERVAAGGLVIIAGDRTTMEGKSIKSPFFGMDAPFPFGVFYLASLMNAPVYSFFGLRQKDLTVRTRYNIHIHKSPITFDCPRKERLRRCSLLSDSFAELLTKYCKEHPFQWYNFFDFWQDGTDQTE